MALFTLGTSNMSSGSSQAEDVTSLSLSVL